ncbi:MAG TPA: PHP-associated domain-containing protein [Candidatus Limnocylindrales bacterium]
MSALRGGRDAEPVAEMVGLRWGRADLHVHTVASDGTAGVEEILAHVERATDLDVVAITDHERIDAALAARTIARARGFRVEVVVGEEVTTRGGHLLALFLEERIAPFRSLRSTIAAVHEQDGLAIPAHPLFPYPMCASGRTLHRLLHDPDPQVRPDALETFNPTTFGRPVHDRVVAFAAEASLAAVGGSDAHDLAALGTCWTAFPGGSAAQLRAAILSGRTAPGGSFHSTVGQLPTFGRQLRKYGRDLRDEVRGRLSRERTGRHLGYPGGHLRPPRFDEAAYEAEHGRRLARAEAGAEAGEERG